jgi:hypothetical protein
MIDVDFKAAAAAVDLNTPSDYFKIFSLRSQHFNPAPLTHFPAAARKKVETSSFEPSISLGSALTYTTARKVPVCVRAASDVKAFEGRQAAAKRECLRQCGVCLTSQFTQQRKAFRGRKPNQPWYSIFNPAQNEMMSPPSFPSSGPLFHMFFHSILHYTHR